ncbi:hypothetical protein AB0I60_32160 [Actinosynnema sp. NPDC050436]|uniref:hypothetical protein n=1 Tax=Actinosynnema sp. NPDC050436 TaxID=3155659 RepID=UPI00340DC2CD
MSGNDASTILQHLRHLHGDAHEAIEKAASEHKDGLGSILQLDLDINKWEKFLIDRPEVAQITAARRDLAFSIYAGASGSYSHACAGLRTFLELAFAAVYFSANELTRRQWLSDRIDFSWSRAIDEETGILSASFVQEFNADAVQDAKEYASRAARCYRHCSQFIHGKAAVTQRLPDTLKYSKNVIEDWIQTARDAAESVLFLLYCRYGSQIDIEANSSLGATLEHSFSHMKIVRQTLGLPVD